MTQLKQFMVVVTGYDLIPQIKKTRSKLLVLISIFLLIFFIVQNATINSFTNDIIFTKVREASLEYDKLADIVNAEEHKLKGFYIFFTIALWVLMSFFSWILLNFILRPVSQSFKEREQFIHNARHELRTPLTIIQSELELLNTSKLDLESQMDILGIKHQVTRMIDLSQNLLSNLSSKDTLLMSESINVKELVFKINSQINSIYSCKQIVLDNQIPVLMINSNQSLFVQLITNIIENIYKHGLKESTYSVTCNQNDSTICFTNNISPVVLDPSHKGIGVIASNAIADKLNYTIISEIIDNKIYTTKIFLIK